MKILPLKSNFPSERLLKQWEYRMRVLRFQGEDVQTGSDRSEIQVVPVVACFLKRRVLQTPAFKWSKLLFHLVITQHCVHISGKGDKLQEAAGRA